MKIQRPVSVVFGGAADLHFMTQQELADFEQDDLDTHMRHYGKLRELYGVWASNQNKYVPSINDFNEYDMRGSEVRYQAWLSAQAGRKDKA